MSKYPYFGKRGRPSKEERELLKSINKLIEDDPSNRIKLNEALDDNGVAESYSDLASIYKKITGEGSDDLSDTSDSDSFSNSSSETEQKSRANTPNENSSDTSGDQDNFDSNDIDLTEVEPSDPDLSGGEDSGMGGEAVDFNPFKEPVIERSYTSGVPPSDEDEEHESENNNDSFEESEDDHKKNVSFDEDELKPPNDGSESVADEINGSSDGYSQGYEEEEEIPEPHWNNTVEQDEEDEYNDFEEGGDDEPKEKLGGDNLDDLSPAQKRKAAEKTAEAIMDMYCNFAPLPFKKWASINEGKVQKLVFNDEINPNMEVENGVTVQNYIDGVNEQVDDIFDVGEDTRKEIKEPLIDVLLEQELALTPTQRLLMAVGGHVVTMGFSAFQLAQNNKQALETFKQFHNDQKPKSTSSRRSQSSSQESQHTSKETTSRKKYSDNLSKHDREATEKLMRELNKDDDGVIDADNDDSVEVEETTED